MDTLPHPGALPWHQRAHLLASRSVPQILQVPGVELHHVLLSDSVLTVNSVLLLAVLECNDATLLPAEAWHEPPLPITHSSVEVPRRIGQSVRETCLC